MRLTSVEPNDEGLGEGLARGFGEPIEEGSTGRPVHGDVAGELLERHLRLPGKGGDSIARGGVFWFGHDCKEEKGSECEVDLRVCHGGARRVRTPEERKFRILILILFLFLI